MRSVKKLTISGIIMAMYVAVMYLTQGFAFGQHQVRIATALYALSYIYPFLILPLGISNFLCNTLMGGLGPLDMIGGIIVGIFTSGAVYMVRKMGLNKWFAALPILLVPGLMVPIWLSYLLKIPYIALASSISIGQILPAITGSVIIKYSDRILPKE